MTTTLLLALSIFGHGFRDGVVETPASAAELMEKFAGGEYREVVYLVGSVRPRQYVLDVAVVLEQLEGLLASLSSCERDSLESKLLNAKFNCLCALICQCPSGLAELRRDLRALLDHPSISEYATRSCARALVVLSNGENQRRELVALANEKVAVLSKPGEREDCILAGLITGMGASARTCAEFDAIAARLKKDPKFRKTLSGDVAGDYGQARTLASRFRDARDLESKVQLLVELSPLLTVSPYSIRPNIQYLNDRLHELLAADVDLVERELRKALSNGPESFRRSRQRLLLYIEQHCKSSGTPEAGKPG